MEKSIDRWNTSVDKSTSDKSLYRLDRPDRSETSKCNKSEKSLDRFELIAEMSVDRPEVSQSTDFEPSITISVQPIDPDEEISFAFSIDDEIPFIDEDSLTSLSKNIKIEKTAIPLSNFFKEKKVGGEKRNLNKLF